MGSLSEHAKNIKAAIEAARDDGFRVEFEWEFDRYTDVVTSVQLDILTEDASDWEPIEVMDCD